MEMKNCGLLTKEESVKKYRTIRFEEIICAVIRQDFDIDKEFEVYKVVDYVGRNDFKIVSKPIGKYNPHNCVLDMYEYGTKILLSN